VRRKWQRGAVINRQQPSIPHAVLHCLGAGAEVRGARNKEIKLRLERRKRKMF